VTIIRKVRAEEIAQEPKELKLLDQ